jgi:hypothetical protein
MNTKTRALCGKLLTVVHYEYALSVDSHSSEEKPFDHSNICQIGLAQFLPSV